MADVHDAMKHHTKQQDQKQVDAPRNGDSVKAAFNGFATAADFHDTYRTASYMLSDEKRVKFRQIPPGDVLICQGRTINPKMTERGLNANDIELKQAYIDRLTREQRHEIEKEIYQRMICIAVTEPRFSMLPPERCDRDMVSVLVLSETDTFGLGDAIDKFGKENDEGRFRADSSPDTAGSAEIVSD